MQVPTIIANPDSSIQQYFAVTESQAALTVTFAQVSYALGLLFIVPIGDVANKTKFIPLLMTLCAMGFVSECVLGQPTYALGGNRTGRTVFSCGSGTDPSCHHDGTA